MAAPEQKELELLRTILQHCAGSIFVTDGQGRIIYSNEESSEALGYSTEQLLNMSIYDLVDAGVTNGAVSVQVIEKKCTVTSRVYYPGRRENIVTGDPVFDENGDLLMVVVYGQKREVISERVKFLEENNAVFRQALDELQQSRAESRVVAESPAIQRCLFTAQRGARLDSTIMLYGESGTGKEVVAQYIHSNSRRAQQIFLPVNCAAIPHELMESEFFGYDKGAFTGSNKEGKLGLFELADGGTLFLDEIGELNLPMQSKLLRVLETGEIKRVGGTQIRKVNVRIVAATNRDLKAMTEEGSFREDLFYRLNVIPITVPPLRNRQEDIQEFATYFLTRLNKKYSAHKRFTHAALEVLKDYPWPGNVRELRNIIERAFVVVPENTITERYISDLLGPGIIAAPAEEADNTFSVPVYTGTFQEATDEFQRAYLTQLLKECGGNVTRTARKAGMGRPALYKKLERLGIKIKRDW